jgi:hypothetical protein
MNNNHSEQVKNLLNQIEVAQIYVCQSNVEIDKVYELFKSIISNSLLLSESEFKNNVDYKLFKIYANQHTMTLKLLSKGSILVTDSQFLKIKVELEEFYIFLAYIAKL